MRLPLTTATTDSPAWTIQPLLIAVLVYGGLLRVVSLHYLASLRFPTLEGPPIDRTPARLLFAILTAVHVALFVLLLNELRSARSRPVEIRRAHLTGAVLALLFVGGIEYALIEGLQTYEAVIDGTGR